MLKMTCHLGYTPLNESYRKTKYSFTGYLKTYKKCQRWEHVFERVSIVQDIHEKDDAIEDPSEDWRPNGSFEKCRDGKVQTHYQKHFQPAASV